LRSGPGIATIFAIALLVLLLLVPTTVAAPGSPVGGATITSGGTVTSPGYLTYCPAALTSPTTGYICEIASVHGTSGYARGWDQLQSNASLRGLSGTHQYYGLGRLNLSAGFLHISERCSNGGNTYARVYVFWHVWVYDRTLGSYVDQSNSGYIMDSGTLWCSAGWSVSASSPALRGAFNSSTYSGTSWPGYAFNASHAYTFTFFLGCTAEASVYTYSGTAASDVRAYCNSPGHPWRSTFHLQSVLIV
jgi:hypothetical protein